MNKAENTEQFNMRENEIRKRRLGNSFSRRVGPGVNLGRMRQEVASPIEELINQVEK